ncbi:FKBP-type peptidyl-prolyl cis-trans isomerase [Demequina zhanjiangensis]|uniref:Peptidyl-prolyl cis-trans isomerase n=1 Tax=Demequina zhanjiangensis TaxID=3051659 RepID=A0ABT8FYD2_9MICO|nr:FKBP-type peptidyl-prolyl cis-trans isomerase [Demequina sp. SYSU T00b26]MDN4471908.1 FKBP-type peptidyl-prolyl cis-trans isomerase [Demequina sp. SYSU T00b26]
MNVRRSAAAAAVLAIGALGLSACTSSDEPDATASATAGATVDANACADAETLETAAALESVEWNEGADGAPELAFESCLLFEDTGAMTLQDGDGEEIADGTGASVSYVIYSGIDGSLVNSTYATGYTELLSVTEGLLDPTLYEQLVGAHVGAQIVYGSFDTTGSPIVMGVTVDKVTPLRAEGTAVAPADGLPTVTLGEDGTPSVDMSTAGDEPAELVAQTLIQGDGPEVEEGQTVTVQYALSLWDGTEVESSWANGVPISFPLSTDNLIEGWVEGLAGVQVGSQVLLIVPPELGYGDSETSSIPANSTLVFVIDVLDAV